MSFLRALVAVLLSQIVFALVPVGHTPSGKPFFDAPAGSRVQQSGTSLEVFAPNGSLIHVFENAVPMPNGKKRASTLAGRQGFSATEAFFQIGPSELIQSFNASFVVPPEPKTFESQILFFGPALESLDDTGAPISWFRTALQVCGFYSQGIKLKLLDFYSMEAAAFREGPSGQPPFGSTFLMADLSQFPILVSTRLSCLGSGSLPRLSLTRRVLRSPVSLRSIGTSGPSPTFRTSSRWRSADKYLHGSPPFKWMRRASPSLAITPPVPSSSKTSNST
ncbi:hypothetical protein C8F01DRAFT_338812 [Mycena amicta]|nr:hypothetical protein C8F01DRAFT_338812 [Mycena amicta]